MLNEHISSGRCGEAGFHTLCARGGSQIAFVVRAGLARRSRGRELVKIALLCFCLIFVVATPARAQGSVGTFTTVDVPGAGAGVLQGTFPVSINAAGDVTGFYGDTSSVFHGFVRAADGTMTYPIDAPGAGTGNFYGTFPVSINAVGDITGMCLETNNALRGFRRTADGTITPIDVPGAGTGNNQGTLPFSINRAGVITGIYKDMRALRHGFVRAADGTMTYPIDVPGAGTTGSAQGQGTQPLSINSSGEITGFYVAANGGFHGFLRAANGAMTYPIDVPGAGTSGGTEHYLAFTGTIPISINANGDIAGVYTDTSGLRHGFVRAAGGTMIDPIDAPGIGTAPNPLQGTFPLNINTVGDITGFYSDASGVLHGFVRAAGGAITPFEAPGAAGMSLFPGTVGMSINDSGGITGVYADASGALHGYVAKFIVSPQGQVSNLQNTVEALVSAGTLSPGQGQFLLAPLNAALAALGPATDSAALTASDTGRGDAALPKLHDPAGATAEQIAANRGNDRAAIRDLEEFIGRVRLLMLLRRLSHAEGDTLIDAAESIIKTLRSKP